MSAGPLNESAGMGPTCRRALAAALITAGLLGISCGRTEPRGLPAPEAAITVPPAQLDVVLVTIDTLRADHVSCYGDSPVATPNIDRLAAEGTRFDNAASTVPFTLPAHASIMTGTYPPRHGIRENVGYVLGDELPTIAESLTAAGRETAGFVSAFVLDARWGIGRGFDHYFDDFELADYDSPNLASVQRRGDETLAEAVRWLDARDTSRPFFLWLHLYDPHDPYTPPEPWGSFHPDRPYRGEVAYTDSLIGELRAALETRGLLERSLLILTADHGEGLGEHGERFHGYFVYDATVRVPLILRLPGAVGTGTVVHEAVSHVDLLPTVLDAAGLPAPASLQGESLLPAALGGAADRERVVYSESFYPLLHYGWAPLRALRGERHKLIAVPRPELYDVVADRRESRNLVDVEPALVGELQERLRRLRADIERDAAASEAAAEVDPETIERLRALGYMAGGGGVSVAEEEERPRADPKDTIDLHQMIMATQSQIGRGEREQAAAALERVVERDPDIIDAHQMLGQIAALDGRHEEALAHYRRALALDGNHTTSLFGLAASYRALGRDEDAILGFERLYEASRSDLKVALPLSELYREVGRFDDAAAVLEQAAASPDAPAVLFDRLGELRALEGRRSEATALFERAISVNPELPGAHFNLAVILEEEGDQARAIAAYERTLELAPMHYQAQFNLGRLYGQRGDTARQRAMWEAAVASNPDFVRGYYYLAKLLMDEGREPARAEELAREGIARDATGQGGPLGWFVLADLLNRRGRPAEAQEALARGRALQGG